MLILLDVAFLQLQNNMHTNMHLSFLPPGVTKACDYICINIYATDVVVK